MKISKLLYNSNRWCKNSFGISREGKPLYNFDVVYSSDGSINDPANGCKSFSLYGAVSYLYRGKERNIVLGKINDAIKSYSGKNQRITQFNDDSSTTYEDIKTILSIAKL